jgi:hypothetical protein
LLEHQHERARSQRGAWLLYTLNPGLQDLAASYPLDNAAATLAAVGDSIGRAAGGTSGGLYHVLFAAAAASLAR